MTPITIDGDLSDWPASLPSYPLGAFHFNPPENPTDFHGRFRIGYNTAENSLYVSVEVDDDQTVLVADRIHDSSGFLLRSSHSSGKAEHFGVWGDNTRPNPVFRTTPVEKQFVDFAAQRVGGHHIYEWRLDVMGIGGTRIEPGALWSFIAGVFDADGEDRGSLSLMTWGKPGQVAGFHPGDMLLVTGTDALGTIEGQLSWSDYDDLLPPRQLLIQADTDSSFEAKLNTDEGRYSATVPFGSYRLTVDDIRSQSVQPFHVRVMDDTVSVDTHRVVRIRPSDYYATAPDDARVHRGVCWVAAGDSLTEYDMLPLVRNGVEWISQTTFGWQTKYDSPEIRLNARSTGGESDAGIAAASHLARKFGIRTVLKPHIWLPRNDSGKWRRDIAMDSEEEWEEWFDHYRQFMLHYARLAEEHGIEVLCVGTELHRTAVEREHDWRRLIADIRVIYGGKLIYAANWYEEFEEVAFWDDLDYIGIQAYFPLVEEIGKSDSDQVPSVEELQNGWEIHLKAIQRIHARFQKPVIITEIGYRSTVDAALEPWKWEGTDSGATSGKRVKTQANCYEAFFRSFWDEDFFAGVYLRKWFPDYRDSGGLEHRGFTPQNKPAELIMRQWYRM